MCIQKTTHLAAALVLVFALVGCDKSETTTSSSATTATTATSPSNEPAVVDWKVTEKKRVQDDVDRINQSVAAGKSEDIIPYMHPKIFEVAKKTPADLKKVLAKAGAEMKKRGMTFESSEYVTAPYFLESEKSQFVIIPLKRVFNMPDKKLEQQGFLFGERKKGTEKWGYIEGKQLDDNNIRTLFPDFPKGELLPSSIANVIKK